MPIPLWQRRIDPAAKSQDPLDGRDDIDEVVKDRLRSMRPLGTHRQRVLLCLGADQLRAAHPFEPVPPHAVFQAFADYIANVEERSADWTNPVHRSIVAAGRLLTGRLEAADDILGLLPLVPYRRDHGAGKCLVMPQQALAHVVPLPSELSQRPEEWTAGSPEVAAVRAWLAEHRRALQWREAEGVYLLATEFPCISTQ